MSSRLKHALIISIAVIALFFTVEYGYGTVIEYTYDANGNLIQKKIQTDTTPPTTTNTPPAGTYNADTLVTLTCDDGTGSGCDNIYYSTTASPPTTVYTSPINITTTTTLKFYAKDKVGNSESVTQIKGALVLKQLIDRRGKRMSCVNMPRQPQLDAPGALHPIMGRGIERTTIFHTDKDREDFLNRLADLCLDGNLRVYAWCLLSNHFHL